MKSLLAIGLLASAGFAFYMYVMPTNQDWVHGRWQYQDPDRQEIDYMVFHPSGLVDLENEKGRYFTCVYVTWGEAVNIECEVKGEKREIVFEVSEDKRTLNNASESSMYVRLDT